MRSVRTQFHCETIENILDMVCISNGEETDTAMQNADFWVLYRLLCENDQALIESRIDDAIRRSKDLKSVEVSKPGP